MSEENNNKRDGFKETRRILKILREEADNASWFTIRHAEVAMFVWDNQSDLGLEVQKIPTLVGGLDQSTVNRILHTLAVRKKRQDLGWFEIGTDPIDARKRRVYVTERGKYVFNRALNADEHTEKVDVLLRANDITMKAEVGTVEVKINNNTARADVVRGMDADKLLEMETDGKIIRVMHHKHGNWWAYDIDDLEYHKPLFVQKDTPKEHIELLANGLVDMTATYVKENVPEHHWDLAENLMTAMATLNRDEYYRLRGLVMSGIANLIEKTRNEAQNTKFIAERHRQKAGQMIADVGKMPDTLKHERGQLYSQAKHQMDEWAKAEDLSNVKDSQGDKLSQMFNVIMKMQEEREEERRERMENRKEIARLRKQLKLDNHLREEDEGDN